MMLGLKKQRQISNKELIVKMKKKHVLKKESKKRFQRFLKDSLILILVIIFIFWISFYFSSLDMTNIESYIESLGLFAPVAIILFLAFAVVLAPVPSFPIDILAGTLYGGFLGGLISLCGAILGSYIAFMIGRFFGRVFIKKYFKEGLDMFDNYYERSLPLAIFFLRLFPLLHLDVVSYAAGLTKIKTWKFLIATTLGMIPITFLLTYYGENLPEGNPWITFFFSLLVIIAIYLIPKYIARYPEKISMENFAKNKRKNKNYIDANSEMNQGNKKNSKDSKTPRN